MKHIAFIGAGNMGARITEVFLNAGSSYLRAEPEGGCRSVC